MKNKDDMLEEMKAQIDEFDKDIEKVEKELDKKRKEMQSKITKLKKKKQDIYLKDRRELIREFTGKNLGSYAKITDNLSIMGRGNWLYVKILDKKKLFPMGEVNTKFLKNLGLIALVTKEFNNAKMDYQFSSHSEVSLLKYEPVWDDWSNPTDDLAYISLRGHFYHQFLDEELIICPNKGEIRRGYHFKDAKIGTLADPNVSKNIVSWIKERCKIQAMRESIANIADAELEEFDQCIKSVTNFIKENHKDIYYSYFHYERTL